MQKLTYDTIITGVYT